MFFEFFGLLIAKTNEIRGSIHSLDDKWDKIKVLRAASEQMEREVTHGLSPTSLKNKDIADISGKQSVWFLLSRHV